MIQRLLHNHGYVIANDPRLHDNLNGVKLEIFRPVKPVDDFP